VLDDKERKKNAQERHSLLKILVDLVSNWIFFKSM
jgi:hypothetical protein